MVLRRDFFALPSLCELSVFVLDDGVSVCVRAPAVACLLSLSRLSSCRHCLRCLATAECAASSLAFRARSRSWFALLVTCIVWVQAVVRQVSFNLLMMCSCACESIHNTCSPSWSTVL